MHWRAGLVFGAVGVPASVLGTRLDADVRSERAAHQLRRPHARRSHRDAGQDHGPVPPRRDRRGRAGRPAARAGGPGCGSSAAEPAAPAASPARPSPPTARPTLRTRLWTALKVLIAGLVVGFLTGFLGVGGGFVIVPALVLALRYEMAPAVGTSLLIISLNSGVALLARGGDGSFHWAAHRPVHPRRRRRLLRRQARRRQDQRDSADPLVRRPAAPGRRLRARPRRLRDLTPTLVRSWARGCPRT